MSPSRAPPPHQRGPSLSSCFLPRLPAPAPLVSSESCLRAWCTGRPTLLAAISDLPLQATSAPRTGWPTSRAPAPLGAAAALQPPRLGLFGAGARPVILVITILIGLCLFLCSPPAPSLRTLHTHPRPSSPLEGPGVLVGPDTLLSPQGARLQGSAVQAQTPPAGPAHRASPCSCPATAIVPLPEPPLCSW